MSNPTTASLLHAIEKDISYHMSYNEFVELVNKLTEEGKTTGENQSQALVYFTGLNNQRLRRINRQFSLREDLQQLASRISGPQTWYVLVEAWCGDVPANLPVLAAAAEAAGVDLRVVLRDENMHLMNEYRTKGSISIPKLAAFHTDSGEPAFDWGPRPAPAQQMVMDYKAQPKEEQEPYMEFAARLQKWYVEDRWQTIQDELLELLTPFATEG